MLFRAGVPFALPSHHDARPSNSQKHTRQVASQPDDAPTVGGPDGNQYFADDERFWEMIDAEESKVPPKFG